jgi:MoaA/NifB/PqqE/SkfB family radical SAM enzyme
MYGLKRIHIELSTLCNSKCITCPHSKIDRQKIIDTDRIKTLITVDCKEYADSINLFEFHNYNEPFLTFDLFYDLAKLVKAKWGPYRTGVVSNGSIMTPDIANKLIDLQLAHLMFSIDGFSPEIYEAHRVGLNRNKVYENLEYFMQVSQRRGGIKPSLCPTVTEKNKHEVQALIDHWSSKYCTIGFHECDGRGGNEKENAIIDTFDNRACDYAMDGVYILSNLDVVPCCEDWNGITVMGNLKTKTLKEIVEGDAYKEFRLLQNTGKKRSIPLCKNCKTNMIYGYNTYYRGLVK